MFENEHSESLAHFPILKKKHTPINQLTLPIAQCFYVAYRKAGLIDRFLWSFSHVECLCLCGSWNNNCLKSSCNIIIFLYSKTFNVRLMTVISQWEQWPTFYISFIRFILDVSQDHIVYIIHMLLIGGMCPRTIFYISFICYISDVSQDLILYINKMLYLGCVPGPHLIYH